jgi:hypothetical protein
MHNKATGHVDDRNPTLEISSLANLVLPPSLDTCCLKMRNNLGLGILCVAQANINEDIL